MEDKFIKYYEAIGVTTKAEITKISELLSVAQKIAKQNIIDTFIEEIRDEYGKRARNHILFITQFYLVMIENYMTESEFIVVPYKNSLTTVVVKYSNYNYNKATSKSSLRIDLRFGAWEQSGYFTALGNNCDHLKAIYDKYFLPNLRRGETAPRI